MIRRGRLKQYADILEVTLLPEGQSTIIRLANITFRVFKAHVGRLLAAGLLEEVPQEGDRRRKSLYRTTEKGFEYINNFMILVEMLRPVESVN